MPDSIIRIIEIKRSIYDHTEIVLTIECLAQGSKTIKYTRTITLKQAFTEYDPIQLKTKLQEYYQKLSEKAILARKLLNALELRP